MAEVKLSLIVGQLTHLSSIKLFPENEVNRKLSIFYYSNLDRMLVHCRVKGPYPPSLPLNTHK